jgi:predicted double-glycine peptidase
MDVYYAYLNIESDHVIRLDRWTSTQMNLWDDYDAEWYDTLVEILPNGTETKTRYDIYRGMASSVMEYDGSMDTSYYSGAASENLGSGIVNGSTIGWATGGGYDVPDGYVSIQIPESAGGMSIPLYLQWDSKWGAIPFGGGTISTSGCGATSMAMIVTYLTGKQVTPDMVVSNIGNKYYSPGEGQSWDMPAGVANIYGIKLVYQGTTNAEKILKYLKAGYPVLVSTTGYGTTQEFTQHGHYLVLRGLDSTGKVLVNDSNDNTSTKQHYLKAYDGNFIVSECTIYNSTVKPMWVFAAN